MGRGCDGVGEGVHNGVLHVYYYESWVLYAPPPRTSPFENLAVAAAPLVVSWECCCGASAVDSFRGPVLLGQGWVGGWWWGWWMWGPLGALGCTSRFQECPPRHRYLRTGRSPTNLHEQREALHHMFRLDIYHSIRNIHPSLASQTTFRDQFKRSQLNGHVAPPPRRTAPSTCQTTPSGTTMQDVGRFEKTPL